MTEPVRADTLIADIEDELGLDVYHVYSDGSRRLIPEAVVVGVAVACIAEFVKAFTDIRSLGEQSRERLLELVRRWRKKDDFSSHAESLCHRDDVQKLLDSVSATVGESDLQSGEDSLLEALRAFGLSDQRASVHAAEIRRLIAGHISRSP